MKIDVLHLSDCHIKSGPNQLSAWVRSISTAIAPVVRGDHTLAIALTGDIAYSGKQEQYAIAKAIFSELEASIASEASKQDIRWAIVPGNHDCDFALDNATRRSVIGSTGNADFAWDQSVPDTCTKVQEHFVAFGETMNNKLIPVGKASLISRFSVNVDDVAVSFWGINSSWMSQIRESPGTIWFPIDQLESALKDAPPALNIALLHHPFSWFEQAVKRDLSSLSTDQFCLVLAGHEHLPESYSRGDFSGREAAFIEGGVLQEESAGRAASSFNLLTVCTTTKAVTHRVYERGADRYTETKNKSWTFDAEPAKHQRHRLLDDKCRAFLTSAGATFRHPRKPILSLDDIYVFPELLDLDDYRDVDRLEKIVHSEALLSGESTYAVVAGADKAGKSSFIRQAYLRLHEKGLTPVRIEGSSIKKPDIDRIGRLIENEYQQQYREYDVDAWSQAPITEKALVVDDFDASHMNAESRLSILKQWRERFGTVILTSDDSLVYQPSINEEGLEGYRRFEILEFGHRQRDRLISKWISIGQDSMISEAELVALKDSRARTINGLIGTSFIPARPVFLLTLLQSLEGGAESAIKGASFGDYYEYLIRHSLLQAQVDPSDFDAVLNYLTELAYYAIHGEKIQLLATELQEFDANYASRYALSLDFSRLRAKLVQAEVFEEWGDAVQFKYRYVKLFFAARYLARNYHRDQESAAVVAGLARHLYVAQCADLFLFITHHSDDEEIIRLVVSESKRIFPERKPLRLDDDVDEINSLVTDLPQLALSSASTKANREERLTTQDRIDQKNKKRKDEELIDDFSLSSLAKTSDTPELDFASEGNLAMRTLAILGQVLRNNYGSLKAEQKTEIAMEAYALLGRLLGTFLDAFSVGRDELIEHLSDLFEKHGVSDQVEARSTASKAIFGVLSLIIFVIVKRASELLGSEKLRITHRKVAAETGSTMTRLLGLALELDFPSGLQAGKGYRMPMAEIDSLSCDLDRNPCGYMVLKRIVVDHFYMFPVDYREVQKVCEALKIPIRRPRQIAAASKRTKVGRRK